VKYESLEQTTSCWVGQDKYGRYNMEESWQEAQSNTRTRPGWTYLGGASRDSHSSMYKVYKNVIHMKRKDWDVVSYLFNSLFMLDFTQCSCLTIYFSYNLILRSHA
jgi:hypothetical protein